MMLSNALYVQVSNVVPSPYLESLGSTYIHTIVVITKTWNYYNFAGTEIGYLIT